MVAKSLVDVIDEMPNGFQKSFRLALWIDTNDDCSPIIQEIDFDLPSMDLKFVKVLLIEINRVTPIISISIDNITYHVTVTEEFMKKSCEVK